MTTKQETVIAETSEHTAFLTAGLVRVYRKSQRDGTLVPLGVQGIWAGGIILGSQVNCGVLVRLEQELREKTGTP